MVIKIVQGYMVKEDEKIRCADCGRDICNCDSFYQLNFSTAKKKINLCTCCALILRSKIV